MPVLPFRSIARSFLRGGVAPLVLAMLTIPACSAGDAPTPGAMPTGDAGTGGSTSSASGNGGNSGSDGAISPPPGGPGGRFTTAGGGGFVTASGGDAGAPGAGGQSGPAVGGVGGSASSSPSVPADIPGVVVVDAMVQRCAPLCRVNVDPAKDPEKDDWSYEDGQSCVIPTTVTSHNQSCMTGEPLPPPVSVPGVVVVDTGLTRCAPLCTITTNIANDPDGDGWSYENNSSCVIPGTITAHNQPCMTGQPLPTPAPRAGLRIDTNGDGTAECVPSCAVATMPSSPTAPDWGYEDNASCVLPGSPTAQGKIACTVNGAAPVYKPPALTGTKVKDGFFTQGGKLLDAYGKPFVMRGVNNAHIFFDTGGRYLAWQALDNIGVYGTNTIRVVWNTTGSAALLAEILYRVVELKMIPMVELHDATGSQDTSRLLDLARYYTNVDVKQVLNDFRAYLLVNIANEWSGQGNFVTAYQMAISLLRTNGITHTLVIDGSGFGQDGGSILNNASALTAADSEHNLLFSVHMYDQYPTAAAVDAILNQANSAGIPLIVGELGPQFSGVNVAWQEILARCQALDIGYLAWSWMGNDPMNAQLDMASTWEGPLTAWGQNVLVGTNGIRQTAKKSTLFP